MVTEVRATLAGVGGSHYTSVTVPVAHGHKDNPQALVAGRRVELGEVEPVVFHAPDTHRPADSFTRIPCDLLLLAVPQAA